MRKRLIYCDKTFLVYIGGSHLLKSNQGLRRILCEWGIQPRGGIPIETSESRDFRIQMGRIGVRSCVVPLGQLMVTVVQEMS